MRMFLKQHFLKLTIIPLIILAIAASFYRFMILKDYDISYEIECDPYSENCYVFCEEEDTDCTDPYYYNYVTRHASDIFPLCGNDVTDCEAANYCTEGESLCYVDYCLPDSEECDTLSELDLSFEDSDLEAEINQISQQKEMSLDGVGGEDFYEEQLELNPEL